jgi:alkylation response protein AidB-like acyl-CoA dehydrogenase
LRRSTATTGTHVDKPHWVVADVATDLDAARLLTYKAARTTSDVDIAIARLLASAAATRAVDAAIRIVGPPALTAGSVVERLSRDVRAVSVLIGTEEEQRAVAAEGLFPQ